MTRETTLGRGEVFTVEPSSQWQRVQAGPVAHSDSYLMGTVGPLYGVKRPEWTGNHSIK
jgi:hypothetical protein